MIDELTMKGRLITVQAQLQPKYYSSFAVTTGYRKDKTADMKINVLAQ